MIFKRTCLLGFGSSLIGLVFLVLWGWLHVTAMEAGIIVLVLKQKLVSIFFLGVLNCLNHLCLVAFDSLLQYFV